MRMDLSPVSPWKGRSLPKALHRNYMRAWCELFGVSVFVCGTVPRIPTYQPVIDTVPSIPGTWLVRDSPSNTSDSFFHWPVTYTALDSIWYRLGLRIWLHIAVGRLVTCTSLHTWFVLRPFDRSLAVLWSSLSLPSMPILSYEQLLHIVLVSYLVGLHVVGFYLSLRRFFCLTFDMVSTSATTNSLSNYASGRFLSLTK